MTDVYERFAVAVDPQFKDELRTLIDSRRLPSDETSARGTTRPTQAVTVVLEPISEPRRTWHVVGVIAAAAVAVAAAGTVLMLATRDADSGQSPAATLPAPSPVTTSVAPTTVPTVSVPVGWSGYTSSRFGYSIQHPAEWTVTPATKDWPRSGFPILHGTSELDRFAPGADSHVFVYVSSTANDIAQQAIADRSLAAVSGASTTRISDGHRITVGGATGHQEDQYCPGSQYDNVIEALVIKDHRFYQIDMLSESPFTEQQRLLFEQMLASFQFDG